MKTARPTPARKRLPRRDLSLRGPDPTSRRKALQQALHSQREALKKRLSRPGLRKVTPPERRRRGWWLLLLALILLLWALLPECGTEEPTAPAPAPAPVTVQVAPAPAPPPPEPPPEPIAPRERPAYDGPTPEALPWIGSLRMQVAARSPRLAECFVGVQQPGRLKWTALVEPVAGLVSEHTLEPMLQSDALTQQQRACVLVVLSEPPYRLPAGGERATPSRVGMVIEF